jgi:hypothetical protein
MSLPYWELDEVADDHGIKNFVMTKVEPSGRTELWRTPDFMGAMAKVEALKAREGFSEAQAVGRIMLLCM